MHTYTARDLPPVGRLITTTNGREYLVDEVTPETRELGDSARGFIMGRRVVDGVTATTRRTRVYGDEIRREIETVDPRPILDRPVEYAPLPGHEFDPRLRACRHCSAPADHETYAEYVEEWFATEYEGEPSHGPRSEEEFDHRHKSCLGAYRPESAPTAADLVLAAVIDNAPRARYTTYYDLADRTGLDGSIIADSVRALVAVGLLVTATADSREERIFRATP